MRALRWLAPWAAAAALLGAAEAPKPAPLPPGVRAVEGQGYRRVEVVPAGRLLGAVAARTANGGRAIVLLAEAAGGGARELLALDLATPAVRVLAANLSAGLDRLDALDLDGDGTQEILLGEPHRLYVLRDGAVRPLAAPGWFDLAAPDAARLRAPAAGARDLVTAEAGRLRCFAPAPDGLHAACDLALPLSAERESRGLFLRTPPVTVLARPAAALLVAVGPQTLDQRRLRTLLLAPGAAEQETWARLPGLEAVQQSRYALLGGQPVLAAATVRGDKLSLFEEQKLRLFRLAADRTQAGRGPFFVTETASPRWHRLGIFFADADGDGNDDLTLLEPKGMDGSPVLARTFFGDSGGRLGAGTEPVKLDLPESGWTYGSDCTGDGRPDLVAVADGGLRVHAGRSGRDGAVTRDAVLSLALAGNERGEVEVEVGSGGVRTRAQRQGWQTPLVVDLDGDGRGEILLLAFDRGGHGALEVIGWK